MYSMKDIKALIDSDFSKAVGQEFQAEDLQGNPTVMGVVLPDIDLASKKAQARLSCAKPGCTNTHIRLRSDWHQSRFCEVDSKASKGTGKAGTRFVKVGEETITLSKNADAKETALFEAMVAENRKARQAKIDAAKAEKKAKRDEATQARLAAKAADLEAKRQAKVALLEKVAAEKGVQVAV